MHYDVAIVGGGPGGSTTAGFLKKYGPELNVVVLEREKFPRDHVGESQLPTISLVLDELGCWDKVEAANFPIKIGASYRWGKSKEIWHFEFYPRDKFQDEARPAKYQGQRKSTAFQVDRAIYDDILLKHAQELGVEVREETRVLKVEKEGDKVTGLILESGETITADMYVDATGHSGLIRRAMGVESNAPSILQNIAIWEYWQNTDWAENIGVGGTMVQVLSIGYGWFWFIPLGPTRTSIGFITSAKYYKESGLTPEQLYNKALGEESIIMGLTKNATREGEIITTRDWSFIADRMAGENWMLVGESGGFADPILAAGLSLTHSAAREAAFTILEKKRARYDWEWMRDQYEKIQTTRVTNHIRFADYWYSANTQFEDLQEFTKEIAAQNGLVLSPEKAWAWLAQGGFIDNELVIGIGGYTLEQIKNLGHHLTDLSYTDHLLNTNIYKLNLQGAELTARATYLGGEIVRCRCYERGGLVMPSVGAIDLMVDLLKRHQQRPAMVAELKQIALKFGKNPLFVAHILVPFQRALEAMIEDGWVEASFDPAVGTPDFPSRENIGNWVPR